MYEFRNASETFVRASRAKERRANIPQLKRLCTRSSGYPVMRRLIITEITLFVADAEWPTRLSRRPL